MSIPSNNSKPMTSKFQIGDLVKHECFNHNRIGIVLSFGYDVYGGSEEWRSILVYYFSGNSGPHWLIEYSLNLVSR
jgi:heat shock protein HspQ